MSRPLRHAVAWSYDHLDDAEKALLERCSVFAGGFDLQSACAVAGSDNPDDYAILDLLDALVRKSLLVTDPSAGRTRFSMLETIRQFAEEQLAAHGAAATVRAAPARYFAGREADILALWDSPRQREAYTWFTPELANLRTAFRWAADHDDLDVAAAIATYVGFLGFGVENYEPIAWAEELIEPASAIDHPRLATLYVIASHCWVAGRVEAAVHYADDGQMVIGSGRHEVPFGTEGLLGFAYTAAGQPERTVEWCRAQLARGRDTHTFTRACIVFALATAGSREEARPAATGLIDAAEATRDPDARRRRLTALINSVSLARTDPVVYVIEDVHWIDEVSESMFADFLTVIPQTHSVVLITYRPEYEGALTRMHGAQTISLAPLTEGETRQLLDELLGADPSVTAIGALIAGRAAGNPFFVEEMVRELAERGVLEGHRGGYTCRTDMAEVSVPATLQAAIAARIDRVEPDAKQTLNAAAVIGLRFTAELLTALGVDPVVDVLARVELVDQVRFTPSAEYAFRHPLIRAVAYESQLKSDRAQLHRRLAAAIEQHDPGSADEKAALIAEHLQAAGEGHAAYGWQMRAATWATYRDIAAARLSWERAETIADALPADDPNRAAMRIAPRTMLCGTAWRVHMNVAGDRFDDLRQLCTAVGDKASLAIAMAGLVMDHTYHARIREASQLASEAWDLAESIGDPTLTVGLSAPPILAKIESAEWSDVLRWSQQVIELADGDPSKGGFIVGSPLAAAFTTRGMARWCLGRPGWHDDLRHGLAMARSADPMSYAAVVTYVYIGGIPYGVLRPDDFAVREIEDALRNAERSGDDLAFALARLTLGHALVHRPPATERDRGQKLLAEVSDVLLRQGQHLGDLPIGEVYVARERARRGDRDEALPLMRTAVDHLFREGRLLVWNIPATGVLVETLLDRGADADVAEAEAAISRLADVPADDGLVIREIWLLRLRALLARANGDDTAYRDYRDRYRVMATELGFEGHIRWAEEMP